MDPSHGEPVSYKTIDHLYIQTLSFTNTQFIFTSKTHITQ